MTPDDRSPDLRPAAADETPLYGAPLPGPNAHIDVRERAFLARVLELNTMHNLSYNESVGRTYREFDKHMKTEATLPTGSKVILWVMAAIVLSILIPAVGYAVGQWLIPLWHAGFGWV